MTNLFGAIRQSLKNHLARRRRKLDHLRSQLYAIENKLNQLHMTLGESESRRARALPPGTPLAECEFKVFSQFGEDGIIQHLLAHVPCPEKRFVEFGVEDFREANCRYLIEREAWTGLLMDGDPKLQKAIHSQSISLFRNLHCRSAFVSAENINSLLTDEKMTGDLGLLSIDIDGNDYWVWKAITVAMPRIVIAEYNSIFGCTQPVSIPYDRSFQRKNAHFSNLYMGASLPAMCLLAEQKGYAFVGSNSAGNNAFFVRKDVLGELRPLRAIEGFVNSCIRESKSQTGAYTYAEGADRLSLIADMPLINVATGETIRAGLLAETRQ